MHRRFDLSNGMIAIAILIVFVTFAHSQTSDGDWATYNRTLAGDRFSPLKEINTNNVGGLKPVCTFDTGETVAFQTGPVVVNGTIYVTTFGNTYAVDAGNCALKWKNEHPVDPSMQGLGAHRGVAYLNGRVFRGANDGHVFAIDAANGKTVWDVAIADPKKGESVPMAPIAWNGMVFVGNAGGDNFAVTGRVYALDAATGKQVWEFVTVPATGPAVSTWGKRSAGNPPTGGALWTTFSIDTASGVLYTPTGNAAPDFIEALHPGENLYTTSLLALDAKTGSLIGYVQPIKNDYHDWDIAAAPALIVTRGGHKLAATAGKDGYLYGIDRTGTERASAGNRKGAKIEPAKYGAAGPNGFSVLYKAETTTHLNTTTPLNDKTFTRFCPGSQGGTEWNGPAYSPDLNLVFVPATDWCTSVKLAPTAGLKGEPGKPWSGSFDNGFGTQDPVEKWGGWVTAVDADTGEVAWKYHSASPHVAAVTATAGGLVFAAGANGDLFAFDAKSGRVLWQSKAEPNGGGIVSYLAGGKQRIAFATGMKSSIWPGSPKSSRVVVFGLP